MAGIVSPPLLAYDVHGQGLPLLLLHGAMVERNYWRPQFDAFSAEYQLICCDLPGHGASPPLEGAVSVSLFAQMVLAFLDALALPAVVCVGHSLGGMVAMELALQAPERVGGLILADTWYHPRGEFWEPFPFRTVFFTGMLRALRGEDLVAMMAPGLGWFNPDVTRYAQDVMRQHVRQHDSYVKVWDAAIDFSATRRLGEIACPTLIAVSERFFLTLPQAYAMRRRIRESELAVIPRSGHWVNWDNPQVFNRTVLEFLGRRCRSVLGR